MNRTKHHSFMFWFSAAGTVFNVLAMAFASGHEILRPVAPIFMASGLAFAAGMVLHYIACQKCSEKNECGIRHNKD